MSRLNDPDDRDEEMDDNAQAGPSRSPRPNPNPTAPSLEPASDLSLELGSDPSLEFVSALSHVSGTGSGSGAGAGSGSGARKALLELRERVMPSALGLIWRGAAAAAHEEQDMETAEERRTGLSEEEVEKWVEDRLEESSSNISSSGSSSSDAADPQAREDVIRLALADCLVSAVFPPTQSDLAALALDTLADLAGSICSRSTVESVSSLQARGGTSSTHLLVALAASYQRRKKQTNAATLDPTEAEAGTTAAVKELVAVLAPHLGQIRLALLAWSSKGSERARWEELFAVMAGPTQSPTSGSPSLQDTLLALCEDWHQIGGETAVVLRHLRQVVRSIGGNDAQKGSTSSSGGAVAGLEVKGVHRNVVHPLELGQAKGTLIGISKIGRQRQAERDVLLHALSSQSLAWHQKERLFDLLLTAYLADADSTSKTESESYGVFCTDLLVAAGKSLSTSVGAEKQIRRSVLLAEIPLLISSTVDAHISTEERGRALTDVLTAVFTSMSPTTTGEAATSPTDSQEAVKRELVSTFHDLQLIDDTQANALVPSLSGQNDERLVLQLHQQSEARGADVPTLIAGDYLSDAGTASDFFRRMIEEPICAKDAGAALIECFKTSTTVATASLDALSLVVLALLEQPAALHTILLFTSASELGAPLRCILTDEEVIDNLCGPGVGGDDESGMLSRVVLFIQWLAQLSSQSGKRGYDHDPQGRDFNASISPFASRAYSLQDLTEEENPLVSRWISELFDSDGIGDEIIRDSPPRILIKLAPTLLHQSILAAEQGVIDVEMLKGGCSFFLQDLLSYTLPSGLVWLMRDLERIGGVHQAKAGAQGTGTGTPSRASLLVTLLSMFLLDESCPALVLELVRPHFERLQSFGEGAGLAVVGGGGGGGQALLDMSTLEALRTRFKREEAKGLRVPELTNLMLAIPEQTPAPAFDRELESLHVGFPQSSSALRTALQPILAKIYQHLSRSSPANAKPQEDESTTTYLASTAAALLVAHFLSHSSNLSPQGDQGDEEEAAAAADGQALGGVLLALDLLSLSPVGRSADWVQPRALVLAHLLRVLAHAPGMLSGAGSGSGSDSRADDSQTESAGKKMRLEEGEGEGDEDLFGDEDKDEDEDAGIGAGADVSAGDGNDASSSRFATLARLCALALLRAISLDPVGTDAGVPAVLAVLPASANDAGKTGRKGRQGFIEKNQRAAVWSIRTVLQLLPSALLASATAKGSEPGAEGTLGKRISSDISSGKDRRRRAGRVVENVVQAIWEVVIVP